MKLVVSDYSGHPFQAQLSRALARRGHDVTHFYFSEFQTPRGNLLRGDGDPDGFDIRGVSIGEPFQKHAFIKRRSQERRLGKLLGDEIRRLRPDVVFSSNAPLDAQKEILKATHAVGAKFVFWVQDLYGEAIRRLLAKKLPVVGELIGRYYSRLEMTMLRRSDAIVVITEDFQRILANRGIQPGQVSVIENWAPLDEIPIVDADNDWSRANGFRGRTNLVYAGTIGYKHNPGVLLKLAADTDGFVTVFSEGPVAEGLAGSARAMGLANLEVRPWVAFADLPKMLAAAEVVIAFVEPDAGVISVPSKVLSYLAAGRPILAAVPGSNLASKIIRQADAGIVAEPGDDDALVAAARTLLADPARRAEMGRNGRAYAETHFEVGGLAARFEAVATRAMDRDAAHAKGSTAAARGKMEESLHG